MLYQIPACVAQVRPIDWLDRDGSTATNTRAHHLYCHMGTVTELTVSPRNTCPIFPWGENFQPDVLVLVSQNRSHTEVGAVTGWNSMPAVMNPTPDRSRDRMNQRQSVRLFQKAQELGFVPGALACYPPRQLVSRGW